MHLSMKFGDYILDNDNKNEVFPGGIITSILSWAILVGIDILVWPI